MVHDNDMVKHDKETHQDGAHIVITNLVCTDVRVSVVNASSRHSAGLKSVVFGDQIKVLGLLGLQLDLFSLFFVCFRLETSAHHIYRHDSIVRPANERFTPF